VLCTVSVNGAIKGHMAEIANGGLFSAVAVSDGRRKFLFTGDTLRPDSVTGDFNMVQDEWKIVALPWSATAATGKDIVRQLPNFQNIYDRSRIRLFAEPGSQNAFREFTEGTADFDVQQGRGFLFTVRYSDDINVHYTLRNPVMLPPIPGSGGYEYTGAGWRLIALPFGGKVQLGSVIRASRSAHTGGPLADPANWSGRIWRLGTAFSLVSGGQSYLPASREGFLTYLFPNDTLVLPVLNDTAFLPPAPGSAGKAPAPARSGEWRLNASLVESATRTPLDNFTSFGAVNAGADAYPDLLMPGMQCAFGIAEEGGLKSVVMRANSGAGQLFTLSLSGASARDKDLEIVFSGLSAVPSRLLVYLKDEGTGCAVNLRERNGRYAFFASGGTARTFKVAVGDSDFVKDLAASPLPSQFALLQNSPNPFNPATVIRFSVPEFAPGMIGRTRMVLDVYNLRGQQVARLADAAAQPGIYRREWAGRDAQGRALASGLYFYRLAVMDKDGGVRFTSTRKMLLVK